MQDKFFSDLTKSTPEDVERVSGGKKEKGENFESEAFCECGD